MLPPQLSAVYRALAKKTTRNASEQRLFDEIKQIDTTLDNAKSKDKQLTEGLEKIYGMVGEVGVCPVCQRAM